MVIHSLLLHCYFLVSANKMAAAFTKVWRGVFTFVPFFINNSCNSPHPYVQRCIQVYKFHNNTPHIDRTKNMLWVMLVIKKKKKTSNVIQHAKIISKPNTHTHTHTFSQHINKTCLINIMNVSMYLVPLTCSKWRRMSFWR